MKLNQSLCIIFISGLLLSCSPSSPKEVTTQLVEALSEGDCDKASKLVVDDAFFIVQMIIDGGCMKDVVELKSVTCKENQNSATCNCVGNRNEVEVTFDYQLIKENDEWKVSSWSLDY